MAMAWNFAPHQSPHRLATIYLAVFIHNVQELLEDNSDHRNLFCIIFMEIITDSPMTVKEI